MKTKIDYVVTTYDKKNGVFAVRVRYENGRDINYNPEKLPTTVKRFMANATHIGRRETMNTITGSYYFDEVD